MATGTENWMPVLRQDGLNIPMWKNRITNEVREQPDCPNDFEDRRRSAASAAASEQWLARLAAREAEQVRQAAAAAQPAVAPAPAAPAQAKPAVPVDAGLEAVMADVYAIMDLLAARGVSKDAAAVAAATIVGTLPVN